MTGTQLVGWALVALGVLAAIAPMVVGVSLAVLVGLLLVAAGALIGLFGLRARSAGRGNTALVIAALTALCGIVLLVQPTAALSLLRVIIVGYFLTSGASEAVMAWELRGEEDWGWMLLGALVSILGAIVLWTDWPFSGARALGLLLGVKLASLGWAIVRFYRRLDAVGDRVTALRTRLR